MAGSEMESKEIGAVARIQASNRFDPLAPSRDAGESLLVMGKHIRLRASEASTVASGLSQCK